MRNYTCRVFPAHTKWVQFNYGITQLRKSSFYLFFPRCDNIFLAEQHISRNTRPSCCLMTVLSLSLSPFISLYFHCCHSKPISASERVSPFVFSEEGREREKLRMLSKEERKKAADLLRKMVNCAKYFQGKMAKRFKVGQ